MWLPRGVQWIPVIMFSLGVLKIVSTYIIAIANKYVDPLFPYISTIASGYPQRVTFLLLAFVLTTLLMTCVYMRFAFIRTVLRKLKGKIPALAALTDADRNKGFHETKQAEIMLSLPEDNNDPVSQNKAALKRSENQGCSKFSWSRLNYATFLVGIALTISYAGVCCVPENVKSMRLTHLLLALGLFFFGTAYAVFDCILSFGLYKLASSRRIRQRLPESLSPAGAKVVIVRFVFVLFSILLSCGALPLLYFADDPLEDYHEDLTKPKLRCFDDVIIVRNSTYRVIANSSSSTNTSNLSSVTPTSSECYWDVSIVILIVTAIIEWLVTLTVMAYFMTFYGEFKGFKKWTVTSAPASLPNEMQPCQVQVDTFSGVGTESVITGVLSRQTLSTCAPSSRAHYCPSISQFSDDSQFALAENGLPCGPFARFSAQSS